MKLEDNWATVNMVFDELGIWPEPSFTSELLVLVF